MTEPRKLKLIHPQQHPMFLCWLFIICSLSVWAQESKEIPMITEMGLARGQFSDHSATPTALWFDLLISADAFYQITYNKIPLISGYMKKGDNRITIPSAFMLEASGTYIINIETSTQFYRFRYEIILVTDIQVQPPPGTPQSGSLNSLFSTTASSPIQYDLEMYIRGNLAGKSRKKIYSGLSESMRKALHKTIFESRRDPRNPNHSSVLSMPNQSLSIVGIPALIYKLVKGKPHPFTPKARFLEAEFIKKQADAPDKKVKATLSMTYRILGEK